jgi:SP family galactose:H+ symporter-like MFS transporter
VVLNNPTNPDSKSPVTFDDETENLNSTEVTQATSIAVIGGLIGSLFVSIPNERYGRKVALHMANVFYLSGAILASAAVEFWMLLLGRLLVGVGWGAAAVVVPQLLSEISPPSVRGSLTVLNQCSITFGAFCCVLLYDGLESVGKIAWRISIGLGGVPTLVQVLLTLFIPESPIWLMRRHRTAQARRVLLRIRPKGWNVTRELGEATQGLARSNSRSESLLELLNFKKSLIIAVSLMFFLQFTGINVILYYCSTIFVWAGVRYMNLATSGVMALNCIMTFVSTWLVDRWGRRPLLLIGLAVMTPSLAAAGLVMIFVQTTGMLFASLLSSTPSLLLFPI